MNFNDFKNLVASRHSCRSFLDKEVELEKLQSIVDTALLSPSARNSQPWKLSVIYGDLAKKAAKTMISPNGHNSFVEKCPSFIVIEEDWSLIATDMLDRFKERQFVPIDIGIFTAHLVLAAKAIGLESCILGSFNEEALKEAIGVKNSIRLVVAVGYSTTEIVKEKNRKIPKPVQFLNKI